MEWRTICYHSTEADGRVAVENTEGDSILSGDGRELITFLAKRYGGEAVANRKVCWNLDVLMAPIFRRLGPDVCAELVREPRCEALFHFDDSGRPKVQDLAGSSAIAAGDLPAGQFDVYYYRQNHVGLKMGADYRSYIYHLAQYYEGHTHE